MKKTLSMVLVLVLSLAMIIVSDAASATINRTDTINLTIEVTININPDNVGENDAIRVIKIEFTLSSNSILSIAQRIVHIIDVAKSLIDLVSTDTPAQKDNNGSKTHTHKKKAKS